MLGQRRRRWPNIDPTMGEGLVLVYLLVRHMMLNQRRRRLTNVKPTLIEHIVSDRFLTSAGAGALG